MSNRSDYDSDYDDFFNETSSASDLIPDYDLSTSFTYSTNDTTEFVTNTLEDVDRRPKGQEDDFLFHVMYAILGVIGFIIVVTLACFVYKRKRRVNRNIRRVRPKSRPGALSLELLERDLMPPATSQPLYGLESSEYTESSDISGVLNRDNSHNRSNRALRPVVENGCSPSGQNNNKEYENQTVINTEHENQTSLDKDYENQRVVQEVKDSNQYETLVSHDCQSSDKKPITLPRKTPSDKKKTPPAVAKKPKLSSSSSTRSTEQQQTNNVGNETVEYANDPNTTKTGVERTLSHDSSVYENPDGILPEDSISVPKQTPQTMCLKQSINDVIAKDTPSAEQNGQIYELPDSAFGNIIDLNLTIPPPSPCTNKAGSYVNTLQEDTDETFTFPGDNTEQKKGYVNIPNLKDSQRKDSGPSNSLGYVNFPNERERKTGAVKNPREIKSDNNLEYINLKPGIKKRGHSTSILPVLRERAAEVSGKTAKATADDEYVHMANNNDQNNEYVSMKEDYVVMKAQDDVYIDMTTGNASSCAQRSLGGGYVNTGEKDNRGYAVPRANTYRVARNAPRYINAGRSKSSDNVYDYADLKSVSLALDHKR